MKKIIAVIFALSFVAACAQNAKPQPPAQQKVPAPQDVPVWSYSYSVHVPELTFEDWVKDGHYYAQLYDESNTWRCTITSIVCESCPDGPTAFTVACVKPHDVEPKK